MRNRRAIMGPVQPPALWPRVVEFATWRTRLARRQVRHALRAAIAATAAPSTWVALLLLAGITLGLVATWLLAGPGWTYAAGAGACLLLAVLLVRGTGGA